MITWITNLFGTIGKLAIYGIAGIIIFYIICCLMAAFEEEANILLLIVIIGFTLTPEKTVETVFAGGDYSRTAIAEFAKDQGLLFLIYIGIALAFTFVGMFGYAFNQMAYNSIAEIGMGSFVYIFLIPVLTIYRAVKTTMELGFLAALPGIGISLLLYIPYVLVWMVLVVIILAIGEACVSRSF